MPVAIEYLDETVVASLSGEIDHHSAKDIRSKIDEAISRAIPRSLMMDFSHVTFMDSSGIGLIMGRYRQMTPYGGEVRLAGLNTQQKKVLRLAGLGNLVRFEETGGTDVEKQDEAGV